MVDETEGRFPVPDQPGRFYKSAIVGEGVMPTAATVRAFKERGYRGYLSIEHGGGIPGKEGLSKAFHTLKRLLRTKEPFSLSGCKGGKLGMRRQSCKRLLIMLLSVLALSTGAWARDSAHRSG